MKLKELMAQKRWNITSFAKALHKSRCTVWNWCNGHYLPNVTDIKAMAELLEVPVEEVVNCFAERKRRQRESVVQRREALKLEAERIRAELEKLDQI